MTHVIPAFVFAAALAGADALMAQPGPRESFIICPGHPRCPSQAATPALEPEGASGVQIRGFSLSRSTSRRARTAVPARPADSAQAGPARHEAAATILFDPNSIALDGVALLQLDQLSALLANGAHTRIVIEGHAAGSDPLDDHGAIAGRRAQAVSDYLASRGIEPGRMELISWGRSQPVAAGTDTERDRLARRVDIRAAD